ncbi:MAG: hypothetical protein WA871_03720 [Candidatus Acidiferrales bacterium]
MTRKFTFGVLAMVAAFAALLATSVALVLVTLRIEHIASPTLRAAAAAAQLIFGAAALLAAVYVATRATVHIFAARSGTHDGAA